MRMGTSFVVGLAVVSGLSMLAAEPPAVGDGAKAAAARAFVASLSDAERAAALRPLDHGERTKWYFARGGRAGLFLRDMDAETRRAALALVDALLSEAGREQWRLIRVVEAINGRNEKAAGVAPPTYGDDLYAVHFFGSPDDAAWAFEIEGHHFVLHAACVDGVATVTPMFTGSFPAEIGEGPEKGKRPLGAAVEVAFELARALDDAQRATARIMDRPPADVLWAVGADAKAPEPKGVARASMTDAQKTLVDRLLATHASLLDESVAEAQLRAWRTKHAGELHFAFVGETDLAKPHYYRLASPCFTIEYDSTNADASHVHCVWSDPSANFGGDALRAHLKAAH
ncbi:MAG: DUF3500 domain-containing protein [Planctomycetota bacterium]